MENNLPHSIRAHSKLGASSAERWFNCPGSVALCEQVPKPAAGVFAEEGTAAHELGEACLLHGLDAKDFIGKEFNKFIVDSEMAEHVQIYVDHVRNLVKDTHGELLIEQKFHLKHIHPDLYGTSDAVVRIDFDKLIVIDFKYGAGHAVEVEENPQLMYYGLGAMGEGDFPMVELHVVQPRAHHYDGPIRKWSLTQNELLQWGKTLRLKALETQKSNAHFAEGDWCRWCHAAALCPALSKRAISIAQTDFAEPPKLPAPEKMTDAKIIKVLEYAKAIENWMASVKDYALLRLMNGETIEGLKLVRGRSSRGWMDDNQAEKLLKAKFGEAIYQKKMLTVAQMEKQFGKVSVEGLFETREGGLTVAHESDKRKAVTPQKDDLKLFQNSDIDF